MLDQVGLTHISFSVSDLRSVLGGGSWGIRHAGDGVRGAAMVWYPDGQLLELLADGWLGGCWQDPESSGRITSPRP